MKIIGLGELLSKKFETFEAVNIIKKCNTSTIKSNSFSDIFRLGIILGFPTTNILLKLRKGKLSSRIKLWCILLTVIKTIFFAIYGIFFHYLLPTKTSLFTTYLYCICAFTNMWLLILKRVSIFRAIRNLCALSEKLNPRPGIGSKTTKTEIFFLMTFGIVLAFIQTRYFFYQEWNYSWIALESSFIKDSSYKYECTWIILFSVISTYFSSSATCCIILLMCLHSYTTLHKIINQYSRNLKHALSKSGLTQQMVSLQITLFAEVAKTADELDRALSPCAFFLSAMIITSFLTTVSASFSDTHSYGSLIMKIYVVWTALSALVAFFVLTCSGSKVYRSGMNLKQEVIQFTDTFSKRSPDLKTIAMFHLLLENVKNSNFAVTGWEMFTIHRGFILNVLGLILSYGVLLYQIDPDKTK